MSAPPHPARALCRGAVVAMPRKCAFSSLKAAIWRQMGHGDGRPAMDYVGDFPKGAPIVAAVRHPVDRLVSCWRDKIANHWMPSLAAHGMRRGMPWGEFLDAAARAIAAGEPNPHFRPYWRELPLASEVSRWLRVDRLAEDWAALEAALGWPRRGIPHRNDSHGQPGVEVTGQQRRQIEGHYARDLNLYRYATNQQEEQAA